MFIDEIVNFMKVTFFLQITLYFQCSSNYNPQIIVFLVEIYQLILKFMWKGNGPIIVQ